MDALSNGWLFVVVVVVRLQHSVQFTNAIHQCAVCNDDSRHGRGLSFEYISDFSFFFLSFVVVVAVWFTIRVFTEFDGNRRRDELKCAQQKKLSYCCTFKNEKAITFNDCYTAECAAYTRKINFSYVLLVSRFSFPFTFCIFHPQFRIGVFGNGGCRLSVVGMYRCTMCTCANCYANPIGKFGGGKMSPEFDTNAILTNTLRTIP